MARFEIHVDTYTVEEFPVVEAKDAYEAAIMYAGRFAPCRVIRVGADVEGDTFRITPTDSDDGVTVEVFEEEGGDVCIICGERGADAEMHDAAMLQDADMFSEAQGGMVHAQCGIDKGWEVS